MKRKTTDLEASEELRPQPGQKKSKGLIILLIVLLLLAILAIFGVWYWQKREADKHKADYQKQVEELNKKVGDLQNKSTQTAIESALKTTSYTTKYEKLTFSYPSNFKLSDQSIPAKSKEEPAQDRVAITAPSGLTLNIHTGAYGVGGACPDCVQVLSEQIRILGKNRYLNFTKGSEGVKAGVSDKPDEYINFFEGKNIKIDGNVTLMGFTLSYPTAKDLKTYQNDPALAQLKQLLQSLTY